MNTFYKYLCCHPSPNGFVSMVSLYKALRTSSVWNIGKLDISKSCTNWTLGTLPTVLCSIHHSSSLQISRSRHYKDSWLHKTQNDYRKNQYLTGTEESQIDSHALNFLWQGAFLALHIKPRVCTEVRKRKL